MTTPLVLTPDQFAELASGKAVLLSVDGSQVTLQPPEKRIGKRFASLDELSEDVMAPTEFTCEFKPGQAVTFQIRPLEATVAKESDDIGSDVNPPKKKVPGVRGSYTEENDWEDPAFLAKRGEVNALRTAFVLSKGLIGFEIPGENLAAKSENLRKKLPPRVVSALYAAISGLTSDPVKQADFS